MFNNLKNKFNNLNIFDINNIVIIICLILFVISLIFGNNIYMFVVMYFLILFISYRFNNKILLFLKSILLLLIIGSIIISFFSLSFIKIDIISIIHILIKICLGLSYIILIYLFLKKKKINTLKKYFKRFKFYSFKELRKRNYNNFLNNNKDNVEKYIEKNNINRSSDYYKVIEDNIEDKSKNELEEFVWINYLRFYKNKRYIKEKIIDIMDIIYIGIHVIILLLIWVR